MQKYYDLEINILSCILQKPQLMEKSILEDKHFVKHKKLWLFMKAVYKKFGTFDFVIMYKIIKNKYEFIEYMKMLVEVEPAPSLFEEYQKQLIEEYNQKKKDKWIIEQIYSLANDLMVGNVEVNDFKNKVNEIYDNANEIFKEGE